MYDARASRVATAPRQARADAPEPPAQSKGTAAPAAARPRQSASAWLRLAKDAVSAWLADYAPSMGAALSYYSVFSMAPLLLIVISVAGLIFGEDAVRGEVFGQLQGLLGSDAAKTIESVLASVGNKPAQGIVSTLVGVGVMLVGATTVFGELQDALDRIWRVPARDRSSGLWALLRARLLSFGMILGIAFLLIVSLVVGAAVSAFGKWWSGAFAGWEVLAQVVNFGIGFALTTCIFAMIYKIMPSVSVQWHDVWLGAAVTSLLFTIGRVLIGLYIGKSGVASAFGAAGSLIVVFVWVYYSAQIFLIGAEFTWAYAKTFGSMRQWAQSPGDAKTDTAREIPSRDEVAAPLASAENQPPSSEAEKGFAVPVSSTLISPAVAHASASPVGRKTPRTRGFGAGLVAGIVASLLLLKLSRRHAASGGGRSLLWGSLDKAIAAARQARRLQG